MQPFNQKESNISCATRSQPCCRDNERRVKKKEEKIKTRENIHTGHTSSHVGNAMGPTRLIRIRTKSFEGGPYAHPRHENSTGVELFMSLYFWYAQST